MSDAPNRVFLGVIGGDGIPTNLIIPASALRQADEALAAEGKKREHEAEMETLRVMQAARARGKLKRMLRAVLGRGRRR